MRIETALNHRRRFDRRFQDIWDSAEAFGTSHLEILKQRAQVFADPAWKAVPEWVRAWVDGRDSMRFDLAYRHALTWVLLVRPDGQWVTKWDDLTEEEQEGYRGDHIPASAGHYWTHTRLPFSVQSEQQERQNGRGAA